MPDGKNRPASHLPAFLLVNFIKASDEIKPMQAFIGGLLYVFSFCIEELLSRFNAMMRSQVLSLVFQKHAASRILDSKRRK